jgi:hypothetical protein
MSQLPKPYDRKHRFGTASSNNPSNPIQGYDLDAEFDAIDISMDETQARLAQIQRDDGGLANDSVGLDQLTDEALQAVEDAGADAAQEVIDAGIAEMNEILGETQETRNEAQAAADAAEACRDQSCACAAASAESADESLDSAEDAANEANDAASSADLARYYFEQIEGAVDALEPLTIEFTTTVSTPTYTLPVSVSDEDFMDIHADGLLVPPSAYSVAGTTVTFTPPIASGKKMVIKIAGSVQIMAVLVEDWGFVYEAIGSSDDWGSVA